MDSLCSLVGLFSLEERTPSLVRDSVSKSKVESELRNVLDYSENFVCLFKTHRNVIRVCFYFNPRCGIWGCLGLFTAADCDLHHAGV